MSAIYINDSYLALLIYELTITLADEIQYAWKSSARVYKIIFALNRFVMVSLACGNVLGLFNFTTFPVSENHHHPVSFQASSIMTYVVWPVFSALRVYAIWDRYWPPAMLALVLGGVPAVTNLVRIYEQILEYLVSMDQRRLEQS
ncbi:hypothetical protein WOLCODRAFT_84726 [Wolfiporia cocos MD-104 SS10]|uniref:DUF6533 domain-containing protein n=1 Tax=Wolfiporia cocos (strain MD-104) TaxID=742152 RepID=A0A2H3J9J0_WOLCO|nr:hypothetical protein WOLCODRAFT_84726 [Wolfiporia cocos MD-104 SS10]